MQWRQRHRHDRARPGCDASIFSATGRERLRDDLGRTCNDRDRICCTIMNAVPKSGATCGNRRRSARSRLRTRRCPPRDRYSQSQALCIVHQNGTTRLRVIFITILRPRGRFVSAVAERLQQLLKDLGILVVITRPGQIPLCEIRPALRLFPFSKATNRERHVPDVPASGSTSVPRPAWPGPPAWFRQ